MDKNIVGILEQEIQRQNTTVELIASENFASNDVMNLCGSVFTNNTQRDILAEGITMVVITWTPLNNLQ